MTIPLIEPTSVAAAVFWSTLARSEQLSVILLKLKPVQNGTLPHKSQHWLESARATVMNRLVIEVG